MFGVVEYLVEFCEMVCRDDAIQSAVNEEQAFIGKVGGDPAGVQDGEAGCFSEILAVFLFAGDSADPFGCMRSDPFDPVHRALEDVGGVPLVGIEKIGPGAGADEDSFFREPVRAGLGKICKGATSCVGLLDVVKVHLTGEEASGRFGVFLFCGKGAEEPEGVVRAVEFVEFRFVGAFSREYRSGENCILRGTMSSGASSPRLETIMNSSPPSLSGP